MPTKNEYYNIKTKDNVIVLTFMKDAVDKEENISLSTEVSNKLIEIFDKKINSCVIIDLVALKNDLKMPRKSRQAYAKMSKHKNLKKVAVVTDNIYIKVIGKSILFITGRDKGAYRVFGKKTEALKWVNNS